MQGAGRQDLVQGRVRFHVKVNPPSTAPVPHKKGPYLLLRPASRTIHHPPRAPASCPATVAPPQGTECQDLVQGGERFFVRVNHPSTLPVPHRKAHACDSGLHPARPKSSPIGPAACLVAAAQAQVVRHRDLVQGGERFHVEVKPPSTAPVPHKQPIPATQACSQHTSRLLLGGLLLALPEQPLPRALGVKIWYRVDQGSM